MIYTDGIHLKANTIKELHEFAEKIGLKRSWFQNHRHPHYDLTSKKMVKKAINEGAILVTTKELIRRTKYGD